MADYTILIADYDPKTTEFAAEVFRTAGFDVQVAKDGLKAVEAFKKCRPILTLIEFMMPKRAGLEVCRDLRHSPEGRDSDLVVMSSPFRGRAFRADAVRVYGATATVEKPLNKEKLEGLLERLVQPRLARRVAATPPPEPTPHPDVAFGMPPGISIVPPLATAPGASPADVDATAQALHDVVATVLGPQADVDAAVGVVNPSAAAGPNVATKKPAQQGAAAANAARRPSVAEEAAGEAEIEDHIDALFDF